LKELRKERKLKQIDVAEGCGIALRSYKYYESGERNPDSETLIAIAKCLGVSIDYLVLGIDYSAMGGGETFTENQQRLFEAVIRLDNDDALALLGIAERLLALKSIPPGDPPGQP